MGCEVKFVARAHVLAEDAVLEKQSAGHLWGLTSCRRELLALWRAFHFRGIKRKREKWEK